MTAFSAYVTEPTVLLDGPAKDLSIVMLPVVIDTGKTSSRIYVSAGEGRYHLYLRSDWRDGIAGYRYSSTVDSLVRP